MKPYHKIVTVWERDAANNYKTLIPSAWAKPEFEYLANLQWEYTEKVDGTNIRVHWDGVDVAFAGRTDKADIPKLLRDRLLVMFPSTLFQAAFQNNPVTLYGEGYGGYIQKVGTLYKAAEDFVLFDVLFKNWAGRTVVHDIAKELAIDAVPIVRIGTLQEAIQLVANGHMRSTWGEFSIEGLVCRPVQELQTRSGHRIITKIKCKDFMENK